MTSPQPVLLVSDACVLIDFCNTGCHDILAIVSRHYLPIKVPRQVLAEVETLTAVQAREIGITVLETADVEIEEAAIRGGPSRQDRLCFVVARDHGGAVWSNDDKLRKLCKEHDVPVFWGLEMLLLLVERGHLDSARASEAAHSIRAEDPHYITEAILTEFLRKLHELE